MPVVDKLEIDLRLFVQIKNLPLPYLDALLDHDLEARGLHEILTCTNFLPELFCKVLGQ